MLHANKKKLNKDRAKPGISVENLRVLHEDEANRAVTYVDGIPILHEDITEADMGETDAHVTTNVILLICLRTFLAQRNPRLRAFANMNLYYELPQAKTDRKGCATPDTMIVQPSRRLGDDVISYEIGRDGPAPLLTAEILSARTAKKRDLQDKAALYAALGVTEYILIDLSGRYLRQRLLLKRLQPNGAWEDRADAGGGITSRLGFQIVAEADGEIRLLNAATGQRFVRPTEAESEIQRLKSELEQLKQGRRSTRGKRKPS